MECTLVSPKEHWRSDWQSTSLQWWEAMLIMVLRCMWPRMNTVVTGEMREWWGQWGDIGKGEPPKPSGSDPARTPWTWTMAYTSQLPGTPSWTKLRNQQLSTTIYFIILFIYRPTIKVFSPHNIFTTSSDVTFSFIRPITSWLDLTLYSAVDKDLRVETSCITILNYCYMCCSGAILLFT